MGFYVSTIAGPDAVQVGTPEGPGWLTVDPDPKSYLAAFGEGYSVEAVAAAAGVPPLVVENAIRDQARLFRTIREALAAD